MAVPRVRTQGISAHASSLSESDAPKGERTISHRKPPPQHLSWPQMEHTAGVFHAGDKYHPLAADSEFEVPSERTRPELVLQVHLWIKAREARDRSFAVCHSDGTKTRKSMASEPRLEFRVQGEAPRSIGNDRKGVRHSGCCDHLFYSKPLSPPFGVSKESIMSRSNMGR